MTTKSKSKTTTKKKEPVIVAKASEFMPVTTKEDLYYEIIEHGMAKKFANFNNRLICARKGSVRIEHVKRGQHKQPNISYCRTFDPKTRITYGIPVGVNDKGKIILKRFYLPEFRVFNLANENDAEEWAILKHHEVIKNGQYKIYDEEKIAEDEIAQITLIDQSISIAKDMKLKDWIPAARFFGHTPEGMSPSKLQATIFNIAKNTPKELINYWEDENREIIAIFSAAEAGGLIHHDYLKGWLYKKTLPLGSTKEAAIRYVQKDALFCKSLQEEAKRSDITEKMILGDKSVSPKSTFDIEDETLSKESLNLRIKASNLNIQGYELMDEAQLKTRVALEEAMLDD